MKSLMDFARYNHGKQIKSSSVSTFVGEAIRESHLGHLQRRLTPQEPTDKDIESR